MIKPIETGYAGCRFRSRLEARWARFFDELKLGWEYEKEGFQLRNGTAYLPDFYLPELKIWIEIKGKSTKKDHDIASEFRDSVGAICLIEGTIGEETISFYGYDLCNSGGGIYDSDGFDGNPRWAVTYTKMPTIHIDVAYHRSLYADELFNISLDDLTVDVQPLYYHVIENAYRAAKAARFEFGESG